MNPLNAASLCRLSSARSLKCPNALRTCTNLAAYLSTFNPGNGVGGLWPKRSGLRGGDVRFLPWHFLDTHTLVSIKESCFAFSPPFP